VNGDTKIAGGKERGELYEGNFGKEIPRGLAPRLFLVPPAGGRSADLSPAETTRVSPREMDLGR